MKIFLKKSINVENFFGPLKAISTKTNVNVLECFLIKAEKDLVTVSGYDLELGISIKFAAEVEEEGTIAVSARLLTDILKKVPAEDIAIESDENLTIKIKSGKSEFSIIGIDATEYPAIPFIEDKETVDLSINLLKSMIRQTIYAVSTDEENNAVHTGVLFDIEEEVFTMVAVDGYRLAFRTEEAAYGKNLKFIVPSKTLKEILKLFPENTSDDEKVSLVLDANHIMFSFNDCTVISRLLTGDFFDYKSTLSSVFTTKAVVNTKTLVESFDRVSLLLSERQNFAVKCKLSSNNIKLSCEGTVGAAEDNVICETEGDEIEIGVNTRFMIEALKHTEAEEVVIDFEGKIKPIKILPKEGKKFFFMILPVRLKN
ncbi:DNA polymerase III subunit beta [Clostridia bacterium]|nr:DNA polymerase III subunit beta [Clostridia bacterium]